jgi:hypothetical protein
MSYGVGATGVSRPIEPRLTHGSSTCFARHHERADPATRAGRPPPPLDASASSTNRADAGTGHRPMRAPFKTFDRSHVMGRSPRSPVKLGSKAPHGSPSSSIVCSRLFNAPRLRRLRTCRRHRSGSGAVLRCVHTCSAALVCRRVAVLAARNHATSRCAAHGCRSRPRSPSHGARHCVFLASDKAT